MPPKSIPFKIGVELVNTHVQLLEHPAAELFVGHHMVLLFVVYHAFHQRHGGVVLSAVAVAFAPFGSNAHRLQNGHLGLHGHLHAAPRTSFQCNCPWPVTHQPETQHRVVGRHAQVKTALHVRHRPVSCARNGHLHKRQRLARILVVHRARYRRTHLPPCGGTHYRNKQHQSYSAPN